MGVPPNGWFIRENPNLENGWLRGTPILGNHHMNRIGNTILILPPQKHVNKFLVFPISMIIAKTIHVICSFFVRWCLYMPTIIAKIAYANHFNMEVS